MANWRSHRENRALFWSKSGHFRRFGTTKIGRDFRGGLDVNWHIPSTCLNASRKWFSTGIYSTNRGFQVAMARK